MNKEKYLWGFENEKINDDKNRHKHSFYYNGSISIGLNNNDYFKNNINKNYHNITDILGYYINNVSNVKDKIYILYKLLKFKTSNIKVFLNRYILKLKQFIYSINNFNQIVGLVYITLSPILFKIINTIYAYIIGSNVIGYLVALTLSIMLFLEGLEKLLQIKFK